MSERPEWWNELVKSGRKITMSDVLRLAAGDESLDDGAFIALSQAADDRLEVE